jgi:hypothetical protein
MLAFRLARPVTIAGEDLGTIVAPDALDLLAEHELARVAHKSDGSVEVELHRRGRMLLNDVLGRLLDQPLSV